MRGTRVEPKEGGVPHGPSPIVGAPLEGAVGMNARGRGACTVTATDSEKSMPAALL